MAKAKNPRRVWVSEYLDTQVIVERTDGFLAINTAERTALGRWRGDESVSVPWELVPQVVTALRGALAAHGGANLKDPTPRVLDGLRTAVSAWLAGEPEEDADGDTDVSKVEAVETARAWLDAMQEGA